MLEVAREWKNTRYDYSILTGAMTRDFNEFTFSPRADSGEITIKDPVIGTRGMLYLRRLLRTTQSDIVRVYGVISITYHLHSTVGNRWRKFE